MSEPVREAGFQTMNGKLNLSIFISQMHFCYHVHELQIYTFFGDVRVFLLNAYLDIQE